jgi:hypothetical protein
VSRAPAGRRDGISATRHRYRDLDVVRLDNGELSLAFLPQVGGRLISLAVGGAELLWRNPAYLDGRLHPRTPRADWPRPDGSMGSWVNLGGSKTWPAPQGWSGPGEWPGPPDDVLDSGTYRARLSVDAAGAAGLTLTSAVDRRTGLQTTRRFTLPAAGTAFFQTSSFANRSTRPVTWSIWEVAQVDTGPLDDAPSGRIEVDTVDDGEPVRLIEAAGRLQYTMRSAAVDVPIQSTVGKLGFPTASGTLRWLRADGARLTMSTRRRPGATYPDGGCPAEIWLQYPIPAPLADFGGLHPDADLAELELLSPLEVIPPGGTSSLDIHWSCAGPTPPTTGE